MSPGAEEFRQAWPRVVRVLATWSGSLDDAEIAEVLSYARSSWGNRAPPISGAEVEARRTALGVAPPTRSRFGNKH